MTPPSHLTVIGSRPIYRFFLPPNGNPFASSQFILAEPTSAEEKLASVRAQESLTVIVNPFDYSQEALDQLPGPVWLWFLKPLERNQNGYFDFAKRLEKEVHETLGFRKGFVRSLKMRRNWTVIVSDPVSREFCETLGVRVSLSAPPVGDGFGRQMRRVGADQAQFLFFSSPTDYSRAFHGALSRNSAFGTRSSQGNPESQVSATHSVVISESVLPYFPYEVALSLTLGQAVLTGALFPRWGLEPGIDLIEYSTPDELRYLIEMIIRCPQSTNLMANRGNLKSSVFVSSSIFARLLAENAGLS